MIHGFNIDRELICEGIIGDGCGGGRLFFIKDTSLQTYDPMTQKREILLKNIHDSKKISKSACLITIECESEIIRFDLSLLKRI